jgi:hypothetical protein
MERLPLHGRKAIVINRMKRRGESIPVSFTLVANAQETLSVGNVEATKMPSDETVSILTLSSIGCFLLVLARLSGSARAHASFA